MDKDIEKLIYRTLKLEDFFENLSNVDLAEAQTDKIIDAFIIRIIRELQPNDLSKKYMYDNGFIYLKKIIKELLDEEKKKITDFVYVGGSFNCNVYRIGNKVFKLSYPKNQLFVPKSKYNVESIKDQFKIEQVTVCFEIMEYLSPLEEMNLTYSEKENIVYDLYRKYRQEGKIWADPKVKNVGMLLKDNLFYLDSVLYLKEQNDILRKGEYANFDVEYIYKEEDFDYFNLSRIIYLDNYDKMETRYKKELKI